MQRGPGRYKEKSFFHHRTLGTGDNSIFTAKYNYGRKDYDLGGHPIWELFRVVYQATRKPYIIGGVLIMLGYLQSYVTLQKRSVDREFIKFHRHEQMMKLRTLLREKLRVIF